MPSVECLQGLINDLKLHLDPKRDLGGDYCSLASAFGRNMKYIWYLDSRPSPVKHLIQDCSPTLRQLERALNSGKVNQGDVSDIVKEGVEKEGCNYEEYGGIH